jgi:hypothetical protein
MASTAGAGKGAATRRARPALVALAAALALVPVSAAHAAPGAVFALQPAGSAQRSSYFVLQARPGATIARAVRITNVGNRPGTAVLYPVDATTGRTTGAVFRPRWATHRGVGAWTSLRAARVRLAPGASRVIPFTVRVPRKRLDGQHLGGIVAESTKLLRGTARRSRRGSFRIDTRHLTINAVQVELPGKRREQLRLTGVQPGRAGGFQTLQVGMRNTGNTFVKGSGTIAVRDEQERIRARQTFLVDTFLPRSGVADPVALTGKALPAGSYIADVDLRYGHGRSERLSTPFEISDRQVRSVFGADAPQAPAGAATSELPILWIALGGAVLLLAGFASALLLMRRRAGR